MGWKFKTDSGQPELHVEENVTVTSGLKSQHPVSAARVEASLPENDDSFEPSSPASEKAVIYQDGEKHFVSDGVSSPTRHVDMTTVTTHECFHNNAALKRHQESKSSNVSQSITKHNTAQQRAMLKTNKLSRSSHPGEVALKKDRVSSTSSTASTKPSGHQPPATRRKTLYRRKGSTNSASHSPLSPPRYNMNNRKRTSGACSSQSLEEMADLKKLKVQQDTNVAPKSPEDKHSPSTPETPYRPPTLIEPVPNLVLPVPASRVPYRRLFKTQPVLYPGSSATREDAVTRRSLDPRLQLLKVDPIPEFSDKQWLPIAAILDEPEISWLDMDDDQRFEFSDVLWVEKQLLGKLILDHNPWKEKRSFLIHEYGPNRKIALTLTEYDITWMKRSTAERAEILVHFGHVIQNPCLQNTFRIRIPQPAGPAEFRIWDDMLATMARVQQMYKEKLLEKQGSGYM